MTVKKYPVRKILALVFVIVFVIFLFNFPKTAPYLKGFFYQIFSPVQKIIISARVEIINTGKAIAEFNNLKTNNERLRRDNQILLGEIMQLKELTTENDALRNALGLDMGKYFKLTEADIIGRDFNEETIIIDAGTDNGIERGMTVLTTEKILIGKVDTVFNRYSTINIITSKSSVFDAKIADKNIRGVIRGGNSKLVSMELIPRNKDIKEGDIALTTKEGGIYPDGIIVGRVKSVKNNSMEPFLAVTVKPAFNIDLVKHILIITDF
ncbi:MAG: rod shape-determining protein MreC [bacterium]